MGQESNPFNARLGRNVKGLRKRAGVTLERLSEEVGVDISFLSRLERGMHGLGLENAIRLAKALGVPLHALAGDGGIGEPDPRARRLADRTAKAGPVAMKAAEDLVAAMERQAVFGERRKRPRT